MTADPSTARSIQLVLSALSEAGWFGYYPVRQALVPEQRVVRLEVSEAAVQVEEVTLSVAA